MTRPMVVSPAKSPRILALIAAIGVGLGVASSAQAGDYKVMLACPSGTTLGVRTSSEELLLAYVLTLTGRMEPAEFVHVAQVIFPAAANPESPKLISEFIRGCLAVDIT